MENNNQIESNSNNNITCKSCNTPNENNSQFCKKSGAKLSNKKPIIIGIIAIVLYLSGIISVIIGNISMEKVISEYGMYKTAMEIENLVIILLVIFGLAGIVTAIIGVIKYPKSRFLLITLTLMMIPILWGIIYTIFGIISCIHGCINWKPPGGRCD